MPKDLHVRLTTSLHPSALDLENICPVCGGSGKAGWPKTGIDTVCHRCQGRGLVLTSFGEAVLDLVRRYETRVIQPTLPPSETTHATPNGALPGSSHHEQWGDEGRCTETKG